MQKYNVKIQTSYRDCPEKHELSAALLIANHFKKDIIFFKNRQQENARFIDRERVLGVKITEGEFEKYH